MASIEEQAINLGYVRGVNGASPKFGYISQQSLKTALEALRKQPGSFERFIDEEPKKPLKFKPDPDDPFHVYVHGLTDRVMRVTTRDVTRLIDVDDQIIAATNVPTNTAESTAQGQPKTASENTNDGGGSGDVHIVGNYSATIDILAGRTYEVVVEVLDGQQVEAGYSFIVRSGRPPRRVKLSVGFFASSILDHEYSVENKQIFTKEIQDYKIKSMILLHFVNSDRSTRHLLGDFGRRILGFDEDHGSLAFSIGTSGPDSDNPSSLFAGLTLFFGRRENLAVSFGIESGTGVRLGRVDVNNFDGTVDQIPTVNRRLTRPFFGISYNF